MENEIWIGGDLLIFHHGAGIDFIRLESRLGSDILNDQPAGKVNLLQYNPKRSRSGMGEQKTKKPRGDGFCAQGNRHRRNRIAGNCERAERCESFAVIGSQNLAAGGTHRAGQHEERARGDGLGRTHARDATDTLRTPERPVA